VGGTVDGGASAGSAVGRLVNGNGMTAGPSGNGLVLATPRYASNPKPEYPRLARQNRWEGVVQLRALISAAGEVETLAIENSSGYQLLDSSAIDGVRRWRFIPARRGEAQVACEVRIPVAFRLER
jgi:TonB family protein